MDIKVENGSDSENLDKCRCCLKHKGLSDLSAEFTCISKEKEVYETILKDTFNIQIKKYNCIGTKICHECITKLKDAVDFKHQVLEAECILARQYEELTIMGSELLKQEVESDSFDSEVNDTIHLYDNIICKDETHHKISQSDVMDTVVCEKQALVKFEQTPKKQTKKPNVKRKSNTTKKRNKISIIKIKTDCVNILNIHEGSDKLQEMIYNTIQLVSNSNMMVFISRKTKFACYNCKKEYLHIKKLREHYKEYPTNEICSRVTSKICKSKGLNSKNVDISNLSCNTCQKPCNDLKDLQNHLSEHGLDFKSNRNLLVPYKLEDGLKCLFCDAEFKTFCKLSIHMNKHSTNNICEICGEAYINSRSLRNHLLSHKEQRCSTCFTTFPNLSMKLKHMRIAHDKTQTKRYCLHCEKTFKYGYQLKDHMVQSHGMKRELEKCEYCNKIFSTVSLRPHIRSVHFGERNHPCTICKMRFFTSFDRKRHERVHGDEKLFACEICEGRFKTKGYLKKHLVKQHSKTFNH